MNPDERLAFHYLQLVGVGTLSTSILYRACYQGFSIISVKRKKVSSKTSAANVWFDFLQACYS